MNDPIDKASESLSGISSEESQAEGSEQKKTCADCGTSKTPLWRGGPAGPKSLCNACGIRSRKKRRAIMGGAVDKKPKKTSNSNSSSSSSTSSKLGDSLKQRMLALGREVMVQKRSSIERRRKMGEVEQAANVLMALSYGRVYA
ncbi:hypothetical protein SAY86_014639 [Trapa natans]|uniref:GATA-type domain-containing protein n=1 Tax=Trapa natans TaxID=22666 RepID=A0AAN7KDF1_TRANT|nr:hypothetical protein SAY86_014639 [Trapa natans]